MSFVEIEFVDIEENKEYEKLIEKVVEKCFEIENLKDKNLYMSVILTTPEDRKSVV